MALSKKPTTGMKDILPEEMQIRDYVISVIKDTYGKFVFTSIETPCVENIANLSSKQGGDNEKLIFKILKRGEKLNVAAAAQMLSGMQAGVGAVIASVTYDMGAPIVKEKDPMSLVIMLGAFLAACILEINVVYIVIVCGLIGVVRTLLSKRRSGK